MLPQTTLEFLLKKEFKIAPGALKIYREEAEKKKKELEEYLISQDAIDETKLYTAAAKKLSVPYIELKGKEIKKEVLNLVPAQFASIHNVIAFDKTSNELHLAMCDSDDIQTIEFLRRKTGLTPKVFLTSPSDMKEALRRYHADLSSDQVIVQLSGDAQSGDVKDLKKAAEELPIINIVNSILEHAVFEGASDIHIEPTEKEVSVRYRVDGMLQQVMTLPKQVQNGIMARVKILARLKIDEHMIPQDGRFKIQVQDEKLSFRVSIIPVYDGEKIVMRLLHEGQKPLTLEELGFSQNIREEVEDSLKKPHGMILVTGPTGSGKTTTLYSVLGMLNQPNVNICTIEDPIEYHVQGINQSQINPKAGFTFASGLRAFLRQDPDIIMVGEIRDKETAEIAIHAAMTGHLVLSTLHTNDAPTTLPRLIDMDIPPFLVAFTANIIIAQRLVRKICPYCKKPYTLSASEIKQLGKLIDMKKTLGLFKKENIKLDAKEKNLQAMTFYRGEGCARCHKSGYKGRMGIYEVLTITEELIKRINERATAQDIKDYAQEHGMVTLFQDGLVKAKQGITTIEEILRVTKE
ncbi:MAG: ATPase, T2SS/T4P/T4SS family [Candidatus Magasanikbacteria bacterium]